ncbi:hypothetical protein GCM10010472_52140 [Pseudonocardia halophobica]|uniref:hypothetical protein n=1 Tax=Pseudonocardia halophobica TaxID=29401 RepID=UPI000AEDD328|nr:hypothetical protein [Pseudonocardia halophobica]
MSGIEDGRRLRRKRTRHGQPAEQQKEPSPRQPDAEPGESGKLTGVQRGRQMRRERVARRGQGPVTGRTPNYQPTTKTDPV